MISGLILVVHVEKHCDKSGLKDDEDCIEISMVSKNKRCFLCNVCEQVYIYLHILQCL